MPIASGSDGGNIGKPAGGEVGSDGTFKLSTYADGDGAVVGKHRVTYSPPANASQAPAAGAAHAQSSKPSPYAGLVPKQAEVEVQDGDNAITIELVKS